MIDPVTFISVPSFGDDSARVQPGAILYDQGFMPDDRLPAQYLNFFLHGLTGNGVDGQAALNSVIAELDNLVEGAGLVVTPADPSQVLDSVLLFSQQSLSWAIGHTPGAFIASAFVSITAAGNTAHDVSAGATVDGLRITLYNSGTGKATITWGLGDTEVLRQYRSTTRYWDGTVWRRDEPQLPIGTIIDFDANNPGGGGDPAGASGAWQDNVTIPGWYACVGANAAKGCPDLTDRFRMGKAVAGAGGLAGSNSHTIAAAELPRHTHTGPSHTHTISHTHTMATFLTGPGGFSAIYPNGNSAGPRFTTDGPSANDSGAAGTGATGDGGFANTAIDVRPANYSVVVIRRCA